MADSLLLYWESCDIWQYGEVQLMIYAVATSDRARLSIFMNTSCSIWLTIYRPCIRAAIADSLLLNLSRSSSRSYVEGKWNSHHILAFCGNNQFHFVLSSSAINLYVSTYPCNIRYISYSFRIIICIVLQDFRDGTSNVWLVTWSQYRKCTYRV